MKRRTIPGNISQQPNGDPKSLPARQREVLDGIGRGRSSKETAEHLKISVRTVGTHLERVMRRLSVHKAIQAYFRAKELGLLGQEQGEEVDK